MSQLKQFKTDEGIEIVIDTKTGEAFASIRGYARMSGKPRSTIQSRVDRLEKGGRISPSKTAEVLTPGGIQGVRLLDEDTIAEWIAEDNPQIATQLLKLGVRGFLHKLAGYEVTSTATSQPPAIATPLQALQVAVENLVQQEQRITALEQQQQQQSLAVAEILEDKRIATEQLRALPAPIVEAPELTTRAKINQLVRNYVGRTNVSHRETWNRLYKEFFYRCSYNAGERAKNRGIKKLDCIEQDGLMEQFYAVGCDLLMA